MKENTDMSIPYDYLLSRNPLQMTRPQLLRRVTAPASEPVSVSEAKLYLRVDSTAEDTLIGDLITAARMVAEGWLKQSLIAQTWKLAFDDGVKNSVFLPMGPVTSIASVVAFAQDGGSQAVSANGYWLNAAMNALVMDAPLLSFRVEITYNTGYGAAADVPKPIKQGMLAHIADLYENRGEAGNAVLPAQAAALYMPFREVQL